MKRRSISKLQNQFEAQISLFLRDSLKTKRRPTQKNVHRLRMTVRRLRAMLWVLQLDPVFAPTRRVNLALKHLVNILGEQRELDVAVKDSVSYQLPTADLEVSRQAKQKKISRSLNVGLRRKIVDGLRVAKILLSEHPDFHASRAVDQLDREVRRWKKRKPHRRELHKFRIAIKKVNYVLEAFDRPVKPIEKLLNSLGDAHDLQVLERIVRRNKNIKRDERKIQKIALSQAMPALKFAHKQIKTIR